MAKVTMLATFYYFFASIVGLFRFLKWRKAEAVIGSADSVSEPETVRAFLSGTKDKYTYNVTVSSEGSAYACKYVESKKAEQEHQIQLNTPTTFFLNKASCTVITAKDREQLKKALYINPLCFIGFLAATIALAMIAAAIS